MKICLKTNQDIIQLVHGNAIDPARIRQDDEEVRDCQFVRLDFLIKLSYDMGEIPRKTYREILKKYI